MKYTAYKRDFITQLARSGDCSPNSAEAWIVNSVPEALRARWTERFYRAERPSAVPTQPRLLNHFKLGADPEFAIATQGLSEHALNSAEKFGLIAGLCVGADNNGRLVELRPAPSRFALEVVASMLSELRWLALVKPITAAYSWKAGAYSGGDGLGGHVHFGRKRVVGPPFPSAPGVKGQVARSEIMALDTLVALLEKAEVYSASEMAARRADTHGGHYGQFSDWRPQSHGYEFRTLPSWLNSPWLAYLSLTLAKLAVCNPEFFKDIPMNMPAATARKWIKNALARYKGLDEDARLALLALDVWGLPKALSYPFDFKPAWGLLPPQQDLAWRTSEYLIPACLPPSIKPSTQDIEDVFQLLCFGRPISTWLPTPPTWEFQQLPGAEFVALQSTVNTRLAPGLGELVWDGIAPGGMIQLASLPKDHRAIYVAPDLQPLVNFKALRVQYPNVRFEIRREHGQGFILFTRGLLNPANIAYARQIFYSGYFPVAKYNNAASLDCRKLAQLLESGPKGNKRLYKVLYEG